MGYPMTYSRMINRWYLLGNYSAGRSQLGVFEPEEQPIDVTYLRRNISGDLRRLEQNALQPGTWRTELARQAQVDEETLVRVLRAFLGDVPDIPPHDKQPGEGDG